MSAADNVQTVKDMYAAFQRGDRNAMIANCAENVELVLDSHVGEIPWSGIYQGHSGVNAEQDLQAEHVDITVFEQLDFLTSETQVAVVNNIELLVKKNGQKASLPRYVQIMTFDPAGKVVRVCEAYDPTPLLAALRS